jgi:hypothetical protein
VAICVRKGSSIILKKKSEVDPMKLAFLIVSCPCIKRQGMERPHGFEREKKSTKTTEAEREREHFSVCLLGWLGL